MSPALTGGFLTTGPPGRFHIVLEFSICSEIYILGVWSKKRKSQMFWGQMIQSKNKLVLEWERRQRSGRPLPKSPDALQRKDVCGLDVTAFPSPSPQQSIRHLREPSRSLQEHSGCTGLGQPWFQFSTDGNSQCLGGSLRPGRPYLTMTEHFHASFSLLPHPHCASALLDL